MVEPATSPSAADYEKLGVFYLGRRFDRAAGKVTAENYLYDSKDLTTHAVCAGMTGSGKTGLCISLLEEAALDGIPAIAIDPKGDLANLMLLFPDLAARDFEPWVDPAEARRRGQDAAAYAAGVAAQWRDGLAQWGQDGGRIARLRAACDIAIYTPGSTAGSAAAAAALVRAAAGRAAVRSRSVGGADRGHGRGTGGAARHRRRPAAQSRADPAREDPRARMDRRAAVSICRP